MYVTVKFLQKNQQYLERYVEFDKYNKLLKLRKADNYGVDTTSAEAKGDLTRDQVEKDGAEADAKHKFSKRKGKWYPDQYPTLYDICVCTSDVKDYDLVYRLLSESAHFSVGIFKKYSYQEQDEVSTLVTEQDWGEDSIMRAISMTLVIYHLVNIVFDLNLESKIDKFQARLRNF